MYHIRVFSSTVSWAHHAKLCKKSSDSLYRAFAVSTSNSLRSSFYIEVSLPLALLYGIMQLTSSYQHRQHLLNDVTFSSMIPFWILNHSQKNQLAKPIPFITPKGPGGPGIGGKIWVSRFFRSGKSVGACHSCTCQLGICENLLFGSRTKSTSCTKVSGQYIWYLYTQFKISECIFLP